LCKERDDALNILSALIAAASQLKPLYETAEKVRAVGTTAAESGKPASILVTDAAPQEAAVVAEPRLEQTVVLESGTQLVEGQLHSTVSYQKRLESRHLRGR